MSRKASALAIALLLGSGWVARAEGQENRLRTSLSFEPLSLPANQPIQCRLIPLSERRGADSAAAHVFRFEIGEELGDTLRSIVVIYDAQGHPRSLRENDPVTDSAGRVTVHAISAIFPSDGLRGIHVHVAAEAVSPPSAPKQLTEAQKAQVRRLASWLWERRCGGREK